MTIKEITLYDDIKCMYLSGASIKSIVGGAGGVTLTGCTLICTIEAIKADLCTTELNTRKLNKTKFKLNKLVAKHNVLTNKELEHQELVKHFKSKKLDIEQSIIKLQACIDKLNTV